MELIIGPANIETFLLKLIVSYLKLDDRGKIKDVHLYDARDKLAAFGNMLSGKGTENPAFYKNCEISFNNIRSKYN